MARGRGRGEERRAPKHAGLPAQIVLDRGRSIAHVDKPAPDMRQQRLVVAYANVWILSLRQSASAEVVDSHCSAARPEAGWPHYQRCVYAARNLGWRPDGAPRLCGGFRTVRRGTAGVTVAWPAHARERRCGTGNHRGNGNCRRDIAASLAPARLLDQCFRVSLAARGPINLDGGLSAIHIGIIIDGAPAVSPNASPGRRHTLPDEIAILVD